MDAVVRSSTGFTVTLEGGEQVGTRYVILSERKSPELAQELGSSGSASSARAPEP